MVVSGRQLASAYWQGPDKLVPIPPDGFRNGDLARRLLQGRRQLQRRGVGLRDSIPVGSSLTMLAGSAAQILLAWEEPDRLHRLDPRRRVDRSRVRVGLRRWRTYSTLLAAVSMALALLTSTPRFAPRPVHTMIAVGVARPSASGQVMTTPVMATSTAVLKAAPAASHPNSVTAPPTIATRPSQNAVRSASR